MDAGDLTAAQAAVAGGASVRAQRVDGSEPLHVACHQGHAGIVQWLLSAGASLNATDGDKDTPLHFACAPTEGDLDVL